jgi:hypothetical protein
MTRCPGTYPGNKKIKMYVSKSKKKSVNWSLYGTTIIFCIFFYFEFLTHVSASDFISEQKNFIKNLYIQKDYFNTIAETRRLLNYSTGPTDQNKYLYFLLSNYYLGNQYKSVIFHIHKKNPEDFDSKLLLSLAYFQCGMYPKSLNLLQSIDTKDIDNNRKYELLLRKIQLTMHMSRYREALNEIDNSGQSMQGFMPIDKLKMDLEKYKDIRLKSKALAISLSAVLPGSGQIYSGRYADGIISLVSTLALAFSSYYSYKRGENGIAISLGFFSALFYAGNIHGAYRSAERYNTRSEDNFRSAYIESHIPKYDPLKYISIDELFK